MNKEILDVVTSVSMEKGVDKEIIFEALEEAISSATKKLVGESADISVVIDRTSGQYQTFRQWTISAEEEIDEEFEIRQDKIGDLTLVDDVAKKEIENIDFGRI